MKLRYRCSTISKKLRYRSSLSSISTNAPSISGYDIEALCFDIDVCVLRYRCFFVGYCLGCCSSYSVLDTDCRVHRLLPVLPVLRTGCALAAHWQHWQQHRPQPPERRPDQQSTSAGPSCWSERSCARTSRVRQAEPGSRLTIAATFDIEGRQGSRRGVLCTTTMVRV